MNVKDAERSRGSVVSIVFFYFFPFFFRRGITKRACSPCFSLNRNSNKISKEKEHRRCDSPYCNRWWRWGRTAPRNSSLSTPWFLLGGDEGKSWQQQYLVPVLAAPCATDPSIIANRSTAKRLMEFSATVSRPTVHFSFHKWRPIVSFLPSSPSCPVPGWVSTSAGRVDFALRLSFARITLSAYFPPFLFPPIYLVGKRFSFYRSTIGYWNFFSYRVEFHLREYSDRFLCLVVSCERRSRNKIFFNTFLLTWDLRTKQRTFFSKFIMKSCIDILIIRIPRLSCHGVHNYLLSK